MQGSEKYFRSRDGLKLFYREFGDSDETVLCLHGLTRNSRDFIELANRLADRFRVICPDVRGRGRSARDPRVLNYNWGQYVQDVWTLMDSIGNPRVRLIGTSLGGIMSIIMAWQRPQLVHSIVLNDIGPEIPPAALKRIVSYTGRLGPAASWTEAATIARETYADAFPGMDETFWEFYARCSFREQNGQIVQDMDPAVGDLLREPPWLLRASLKLGQWGLIRQVNGVPFDLWPAFRSLRVPVLLLQGELSDVMPAQLAHRMKSEKPDIEVVTVPDRGHVPLLDEPVAVRALEAFVAR